MIAFTFVFDIPIMKGTQNIFFWFVVGGYVKGGCVSGLGGRIRRTLLRPWGTFKCIFFRS